MWNKRNNFADEHQSAEILGRYVGMSVFWYFGVLLAWSVVQWLLTGKFEWNLAYLLFFWMACSIKDGSTTACKWGIFCMLGYGTMAIAACFLLLLRPAPFEFHYALTPAKRTFYFVALLLFVFWSVLNLKYLLQILRLRQVRFWNKYVFAGYAAFAGLMFIMLTPFIMNYFGGYSRGALETKYNRPIDYLRQAVLGEVSTESDSPELKAICQAYPEIIEMLFHTRDNRTYSVLHQNFRRGGKPGTVYAGVPESIDYVTYRDYLKNRDGKWVRIELKIEKK
jgi:hypothetical protein